VDVSIYGVHEWCPGNNNDYRTTTDARGSFVPRASVVGPSCQDGGMEKVLGIGGYFMRSSNPAELSAWYRDCLGLDNGDSGAWRQADGQTVFATFDADTDYFGSRDQQSMLNFRVGDLDAMLVQLRSKGADVADDTHDMEGVGRFGWVTDPDGNRIELWQPA
jgi:predicted enzyme related to lactoylglutathione lyase